MKNSKGFTLVELMIVIAIIGILAAVLYPSITGYFERSRDTSKKAKINNLEIAVTVFYGDNNTFKIIPRMSDFSYWISYRYTDSTTGGFKGESILDVLEQGGYIKKGIIENKLTGNTKKVKNKICTGLNGYRPHSNSLSYSASHHRYTISGYLETLSNTEDELHLRDNLHNGKNVCEGKADWTAGADNYGVGN